MSGGRGSSELSLGRWLVLRWSSRRYEVEDRSMEPEFLPGDRLLVQRQRRGRPLPREGEVIVLRDPSSPERLLLKRVLRQVPCAPGRPVDLDVRGDQASSSRDSRSFGPVRAEMVVGRVWYRYAPPERRGSISGPRGPAGADRSPGG